MSVILFFIITIGQYIVAWAAYIEKKFTTVWSLLQFIFKIIPNFSIFFIQEQILGEKIKKMQKKNKTNVDIDDILAKIPSPSVKNTLPFQIPVLIYTLFTQTPRVIRDGYSQYQDNKLKEMEKIKM